MKNPKADAIRRALQAGMSTTRATERSGATRNYVLKVARDLGYRNGQPRRPRNEGLRQAIVDGYANHLTPTEIATQQDSTSASVRVLACRLGVSRRPAQAVIERRGFAIPAHLEADYANLQRKHYTTAEIGGILGLKKSKAPPTEVSRAF